jgi:aminoglycoside phosphotransferase
MIETKKPSVPAKEVPESVPSRTFEANYFQRRWTLLKVAILEHFRPHNGCVLFVSKDICVKYGNTVNLSEAAALHYISANTSIPVPKLHYAFESNGMSYIVMERIQGNSIGKGWSSRPQAEQAELLRQLKGYIDELRALPHPRPGTIAAADWGCLYDHRLYNGHSGYGPFSQEEEFNMFLRNGTDTQHIEAIPDDRRSAVQQVIEFQQQNTHKVCFTHGDLSSSNVLVRDGKVVGIIDFEMSGWLPEYWEYTTAMNVNVYDEFWKSQVERFLEVYPRELEIEELRRRTFGDL